MTDTQIKELIVLIALTKVTANQQLLVEPSQLQRKLKQVFKAFLFEGNKLYKQLEKDISLDVDTMDELMDDIESVIAEKRRAIEIEII
jgi:hypothetical protein